MIRIRMLRNWSYFEDPSLVAETHLPKGWMGEVADDIGAVAIADGVAEPLGTLSDKHEAAVKAAREALAVASDPPAA